MVRLVVADSVEDELIKMQRRKRENKSMSTAEHTDEILRLFGVKQCPQWFKDAFPEVYAPGADADQAHGDTDVED